jgi:hypothetical protein
MAKCIDYSGTSNLIGKLVYTAFRAQCPGKIIKELSISESRYPTRNVLVKFIDGTESEMSCIYLKDFDALIADHEKKLSTHKSKLAALNAIV